MSLFPFPKSKPLLDFSRRRGPPAPLRLDAAYTKKVERGFEKFTEPNPPTTCLVVDSECDQVFRLSTPHDQLSGKTVQGQRSSITWNHQQGHNSVIEDCFYTLDHTQGEESSYDGSEHTLWSSGGVLSETESRRGSSCTSSSTDVDTVDGEKVSSKESLSSKSSHQAWWKQHNRSMSCDSESSRDSPISMPAQCRIDQGGSFKDWNESKSKYKHHRSQSY